MKHKAVKQKVPAKKGKTGKSNGYEKKGTCSKGKDRVKHKPVKQQGRIHGRISRLRFDRSSDARTAQKTPKEKKQNKCVTD